MFYISDLLRGHILGYIKSFLKFKNFLSCYHMGLLHHDSMPSYLCQAFFDYIL